MSNRSEREGHIRIIERNGVRTMKFEHAQQSSMRIDDPFDTDFEYPAYLHIPLAIVPDAQRAFVIGLGGGTVVKRFWRDYPQMTVDTVEIDPGVIGVAHSQFGVPIDPRIHVLLGDGRRHLEETQETYDVIICDAYDDDRVPRHLLTEEFCRSARDRMSENGAIAFNVTGSISGFKSRPFRRFHRTVTSVWPRVWTFPVMFTTDGRPSGYERNIIVVATGSDVTTDELLGRIANRVGGLVTVPGFRTLGADLFAGKLRTGDVPTLTDPPGWRR